MTSPVLLSHWTFLSLFLADDYLGVNNIIIKEQTKMTKQLVDSLVDIWEDSVKATHHFLSLEEIAQIKHYVPQAIKGVSHLITIEDDNEIPFGFMGIDKQKLEMLFVSSDQMGSGAGKALLTYGIKNHDITQLTVNEQNPAACGFYEHMGFTTYKRTEHDEEGNPYPILYMTLRSK